jgi:hypothetical protein
VQKEKERIARKVSAFPLPLPLFGKIENKKWLTADGGKPILCHELF